MFDNLKAWYKNRFQKPYGVDVIVVECGDLYRVDSTANANSLFAQWRNHWAPISFTDKRDTVYIDGNLFFRKKEEAIEFAKLVYDHMIDEKKAKTIPSGKSVIFRAS